MKEIYIPIIREVADEVRRKYDLADNAVIGDYIFTILQNECIVIMKANRHQPDLDGFSTEKIVKERLETVVYINTAKNVEKQNFCAAHELGHRYRIDCLLHDAFPHEIILSSDVEEIMNRFAAELMMPEGDFRARSAIIWKEYGISGQNGKYQITVKGAIQAVIRLMDFYYMPYKAVLYRMEEVGLISLSIRDRLEHFESGNRNVVDRMISQMGITRLRTPDYKLQTSIPVLKDMSILVKSGVTKYLTPNELTQYLKNLGLSKESIALADKMRRIETEMLDL